MSLYTSVYFVPRNRKWIADSKFISELAQKLRVESFDIFVIYSGGCPLECVPGDIEDDGKEVLNRRSIPIHEALPMVDETEDRWTLMMFPLGSFIRELSDEILKAISPDLSRDFLPWDASISHGRWRIYDYDDGGVLDGGQWAFKLSANGCPSELDLYLNEFLKIAGVAALKSFLESVSNCEWEILINLT